MNIWITINLEFVKMTSFHLCFSYQYKIINIILFSDVIGNFNWIVMKYMIVLQVLLNKLIIQYPMGIENNILIEMYLFTSY